MYQDDEAPLGPSPFSLDPQVLSARPNAARVWKSEIGPCLVQTANRFLPLARLRLRTRRPPLVLILRRKPCVLLREMLLG